MGGGSGGVPSASINEVLAAAEQQLKRMASEASRILIACEPGDRPVLDDLLRRHGPFPDVELRVASTPPIPVENDVAWANWVAVFTASATETQTLDHVVEACLQMKKAGVHVKSTPAAKIPSRVSAYRWRSILWVQFVALITPAP